MSFRVKPTQESVPEVQERAWTNTAFLQGSPLIVHTDGTFREAGADPSTIAAIALHDVGTGSGAEFPTGTKEFPAGVAQAVLLKPGMKFTAQFVGAMGTVGTAYGIVKGADGIWRIDFSETSTTQFRLVKSFAVSPLNAPLVEVVVITAAIQAA